MLIIYVLFEFAQESFDVLPIRNESEGIKTCGHGFNLRIWYNGGLNL